MVRAMNIPTPRKETFTTSKFSGSVSNWHRNGKGVSQFFNNLSTFFPEGEKFFIQSVRSYRPHIKQKELREAVVAFIKQEGQHGKAHRTYNEQIQNNTGVSQEALERFVRRLLVNVHTRLPKPLSLAATCALEHLTAIMGEVLLRYPEYIQGSSPEMVDLWRWHQFEEWEHKSVCFDVLEEQVGSYVLRCSSLIVATQIFIQIEQVSLWGYLKDSDCSLREWFSCYRFILGRNGGFLWKCVIPWFHWFKPNFHPTDRDRVWNPQSYESMFPSAVSN